MRISDWSSDVCSSDLPRRPRRPGPGSLGRGRGRVAGDLPRDVPVLVPAGVALLLVPRRRHHRTLLRLPVREHAVVATPPAAEVAGLAARRAERPMVGHDRILTDRAATAPGPGARMHLRTQSSPSTRTPPQATTGLA